MTSRTELATELRELADDIFCTAVETVLDVQQTGLPYNPQLWADLTASGLTLLSTPEESGGSGAGLQEASVILDSAGYHAAPIPIGENDLLASWLLQNARLPISAGPMTASTCPDGLDGSRLTTDLGGQLVPWAAAAEVLVVAGRDFVAALTPEQYDVATRPDLAGQPAGAVHIDVTLDDTQMTTVTTDFTEEFVLRGALLRSHQTCGALSRALEMACTHATTREQFGRPIARFQAVQALIANAASSLALARAAAAYATDAAQTHGFSSPQARFAIAVAKVESGRAATVVTRNAHQVHGAIGFTLDHRLRHFTTRASAWRNEFGNQRFWQNRLGQELLDSGESAWEFVTSH